MPQSAAAMLLERGADVGATDASGDTPLHGAVHIPFPELVFVLGKAALQAGPCPSSVHRHMSSAAAMREARGPHAIASGACACVVEFSHAALGSPR